MKSVVVVVLSWNKQQAVIDCLDRLNALTGADIQVVVVDNASSDDSVSAIRRAHPDATVLEEPVNRGFAGGVNAGLAEAARRNADYAWLLNDDTQFAPTVLMRLLAHADANPDCGLLSPALFDLDDGNGEQFRNGLVDWSVAAMAHNLPSDRYAEALARNATPIVPGTAMLCDLRVYRAIGPFDPRYFAYWEDTDYALRAADAGFASVVVDASRMQHAATPTRHDRPPHYHYYMVRNEALFFERHAVRHRSAPWKRRWLAASLEWLAENRDLGRRDNALACIDGMWHALTKRYGARSDHAPAPRWLSGPLLARPWFFTGLVRGEWHAVFGRLFRPT